jgi:hypothetical protein
VKWREIQKELRTMAGATLLLTAAWSVFAQESAANALRAPVRRSFGAFRTVLSSSSERGLAFFIHVLRDGLKLCHSAHLELK